MFVFLKQYAWWLFLLSWLGLLSGCSFHGRGDTRGHRELGLHYTVDTSLTWVTKTEDGNATNEEWLGVEWTGFGPPPPPAAAPETDTP